MYISITSIVGSVSLMFVKGFSLAGKLTFAGKNQFIYPRTYIFGLVSVGPSTMGVGMRARSPQLALPRVNPFGGAEPLSAGGDRGGVGPGLQSLLEGGSVLRRERYRGSKHPPHTRPPARFRRRCVASGLIPPHLRLCRAPGLNSPSARTHGFDAAQITAVDSSRPPRGRSARSGMGLARAASPCTLPAARHGVTSFSASLPEGKIYVLNQKYERAWM
ncbi:hypothetical protein DFH08DRAFT_941725 [Mycena albidolilacea]|uniref:Uncharacterized protein n=1 Tax=Mycena albidolilacea TaxID=1033008 RepID=A0AAD6ZIG3_9AGAR|nr:hypothetical protein DFH08DRAFT_941725 [Mycena albidolilacea]